MDISLTQLPSWAQVGAFIVVAGAGVGAFTYYYEYPARAESAARQRQLTSLGTDIEKGTAMAKRRPALVVEVDDLEDRLTSLRGVLPEEQDVADLLRRLQTVAAQSNLTITSFKPAPVAMKPLHAEWPVNLELIGTYHNLATFFDRLRTLTPIVTISSVAIRGLDKADARTTISATCVATTFVLLDNPVPVRSGAAPGAKAQTEGRDPFLSPQGTRASPHTESRRAEGLGGLALSEISVRGVIGSPSALVAMVQGPDNKTYLIHRGDTLADGVVKSVTDQGLVVLQDIGDPRSTSARHEVRKLLRSFEGGKQ